MRIARGICDLRGDRVGETNAIRRSDAACRRRLTQTAPDEKSEAEQESSLGDEPRVGWVTRCAPGRIRTCDTRFRRAVLYPLSYEGGDLPKICLKRRHVRSRFLACFGQDGE